ncbi:MAG: hydrogenase [Sulfurovum sp.]|jgi:nitrogen fixation protein NifQ|nr:MAG: hydrogenase [Sulfurovum sp.]
MESLKNLEDKVSLFLAYYAKDSITKEKIAPYIAKRSLLMKHLYEDLGFDSRIQMNRFMLQHFPSLWELKPKDKLWKKFIYDSIGEIAPACASCPDQFTCFRCSV